MSERGTSRCYSHDPETNHLRVYIRRRTRVRSWPRAKIARWQRWGNDSASGTPYRFVNTPRGYAPGEKPVAWASLTSRSKSLEDDRKCLSVTTSFLPTDRDFLFRALFSLSLGPLNLNLHIGKKLRYRSLVNLRYSRLDCSLRR